MKWKTGKHVLRRWDFADPYRTFPIHSMIVRIDLVLSHVLRVTGFNVGGRRVPHQRRRNSTIISTKPTSRGISHTRWNYHLASLLATSRHHLLYTLSSIPLIERGLAVFCIWESKSSHLYSDDNLRNRRRPNVLSFPLEERYHLLIQSLTQDHNIQITQ